MRWSGDREEQGKKPEAAVEWEREGKEGERIQFHVRKREEESGIHAQELETRQTLTDSLKVSPEKPKRKDQLSVSFCGKKSLLLTLDPFCLPLR